MAPFLSPFPQFIWEWQMCQDFSLMTNVSWFFIILLALQSYHKDKSNLLFAQHGVLWNPSESSLSHLISALCKLVILNSTEVVITNEHRSSRFANIFKVGSLHVNDITSWDNLLKPALHVLQWSINHNVCQLLNVTRTLLSDVTIQSQSTRSASCAWIVKSDNNTSQKDTHRW